MTMENKKCDICDISEPIGVASTSVPFSCAMCLECTKHGADPEWIFKYYKDTEGYKPEDLHKSLTTFSNGKYMTYEEWYNQSSGL